MVVEERHICPEYHSLDVQAVHTILEDLAVMHISTSLLLHITYRNFNVPSLTTLLSHSICLLQRIFLVLSFTRRSCEVCALCMQPLLFHCMPLLLCGWYVSSAGICAVAPRNFGLLLPNL